MLFIYTIIFIISIILYYMNLNIIASVLVISLALFLFITQIKKTKRVCTISGFFALGFVGGFGISLLKLSKLSTEYSIITFIAVFVSYFSIYIGEFFANKNKTNIKLPYKFNKSISDKLESKHILLIALILVTFISFIIEAVKLKFIPLFTTDTPHAYSTFHIFGFHYITTFHIFIPSFAICNFFADENIKNEKVYKKDSVLLLIAFMYSITLSILMVSRAQLIMSIFLAVFTFTILKSNKIFSYLQDVFSFSFLDKKKIKKQITFFIYFLGAFIAFILIYIVITVSRAHNIEYLNGIFEMKNKDMPIFITQPYMYIAHNFENLNYMINNTFRWTFGRRMLFPFFTLTLIKKFFPIVASSPYYLIKNELSTTTLIYDFYYDFGLVGVILSCFVIGYVFKKIENKVYYYIEKNNFQRNNYITIVLALLCYYMFFSFFQAYFSLTDTWVYLIFLILIIGFVRL